MAERVVEPVSAGVAPGAQAPRRSPWGALAVLTLIYTFSFVDRKMPLILIESIKADLQLSDTQIGLMTGIAFTLVYALAGLPLAILAEKYGRKRIIWMCVLAWSALTAAGALATNFWQLMVTRMGVAVGEAGGTPASHSLIGSYFPDRRATALAVFSIGAPLGAFIGLSAGGFVNDLADWRTTLIVVGGIPGLVIALLVILVIKEPPRLPNEKTQENMISGVRVLLKSTTVRHLCAAGVLFGCAGGATMSFTPAFAMRSFGLSSTQVGLSYGVVVGLLGGAGVILSGVLSDRLGKRDVRWGLWLVGGAMMTTVPFHLMAWNAPSHAMMLAFLVVPELFQSFHAAPTFAALQTVAPVRLRALASATWLLFATGIGLTVGPFLAGFLSDHLQPVAGVASLGWALSIVTLLKLWAGFHYFRAASHLKRERLEAAQA